MVLPSMEIDWWLNPVSQLSTELCFVKSKQGAEKEEGGSKQEGWFETSPSWLWTIGTPSVVKFSKSGDKNESSIDLIDL